MNHLPQPPTGRILALARNRAAGAGAPVIGLPNGSSVSIPSYVLAWRLLQDLPAAAPVAGFGHFPEPAGYIRSEMSRGVDARINQALPGFGQGRKWDEDWQRAAVYTARLVNGTRVIVDWLPPDLRKRLKHRRRDCRAAAAA